MKNRFQFDRNEDSPNGSGQLSNNLALPGNLLIASPYLENSPFSKTVVLMIQHNQNGSFGVVLNRAADESVRNAWLEMTGLEAGRRIVAGGPVGGPVFAIHQSDSLAEMEISGGIFLTANTDALKEIVVANKIDYRIIFGVATWQTGQLAQEMQKGFWFNSTANAEQVFDDPEWLWEKSLKRHGRDMICDLLGLEDLPNDPTMN